MIGSSVAFRTRSWTVLLLDLLTTASPAAFAADCPGHPDALGTSRTIVVDPDEHPPIGFMRADGVENYLTSRGVQVWRADFRADDWRHVSPDRFYQLAMQRLEAKGKGILLLHDIQPLFFF